MNIFTTISILRENYIIANRVPPRTVAITKAQAVEMIRGFIDLVPGDSAGLQKALIEGGEACVEYLNDKDCTVYGMKIVIVDAVLGE